MSTVHFIRATLFTVAVTFAGLPVSAQQGPIKPFKDALFSGQAVLESADGGDYQVLDYQEMRDINGRDQVPERRVKNAYVATSIKRQQVDLRLLEGSAHAQNVTQVGDPARAAFAVIFIHGRGGDRRLGANDYSFGGNFNRLKNLVAGSGGVYYAPSVADFGQRGSGDIAALIGHVSGRGQGQSARPVVLACASMGGMICSGIARDPQAAARLAGMVILGGPPDAAYASTPAGKRKLPIYFVQGSNDSVYKAADQVAVYRKLRGAGHPVRFTLFQTGSHGTPIRMIDWRAALNFVLSR